MAVIAARDGALSTGGEQGVRPVHAWHFARLKVRLIRNGLRGRPGRVVSLVLGLVWAAGMAALGFLAFLGSGAVRSDAGLVIATYVGSGLVLGWMLLPVLFFGVDETLDPARFALFPLRRRTLATGMLAAACVGIPGAASALALLGLAAAGAVRAGLPGALVGLAGAVLGLLLCVVLSRALTSALAAMLRSRRVRDLTAVVIALLSASVGPLQLLVNHSGAHPGLGPALRAARVLDWTPFAAAFVGPYDVAAGRPLLALARLAIVAVAVVLLLWWWSRTLESAMLGGSSGGEAGGAAVRGGAVAALVPRLVRPSRPGVHAAIIGRELRYWWRDPRRRSGLLSISMGAVMAPIAILFANGRHGGSGMPLAFGVALPSAMTGAIIANQFGFDGTAYSVHLLAGVRGRTDLRARAAALAVVLWPALLVLSTALTLYGHAGRSVAAVVGTVSAVFGASLGAASLISVLAPYPMAASRNALAVNSGSGSAKGLLAFAGMLGALAFASPVLIAAILLPSGASWLLAPVGIGWGVGAVLVATYIAGDRLERRGPELLTAVTPST